MGVRGKALGVPVLGWHAFAALVVLAGSSCKDPPHPRPKDEPAPPSHAQTKAKPKSETPRTRPDRPLANDRPARLTAKPAEYRDDAKPPSASRIRLGDGWGCAELADRSYYCWEAPSGDVRSRAPVLANHVAWLDDTRTSAGPDRICRRNVDGARCFRAPEFMRDRGSLARTPGSQASDNEASWALPAADLRDPLVDATPVQHGAFRGCSDGLCWGPQDGAPAASPDLKLCRHQQLVVPCAVAESQALSEFHRLGLNGPTMIGDLFGCARTHRGLLCIGASRDGLFGTQAACPPELRSAWPTATGTVPAPMARCSRTPVPLRSGPTFGNKDSAGPRGVCAEELTSSSKGLLESLAHPHWPELHCFGAVWLPKLLLSQVEVGLGDEPSACGIDRKGQVHCWGARYSERGHAARPIEFVVPKAPAMVVGVAGPFRHSCGINRNCGRSAESLSRCRPGTPNRTVHDVFEAAESLEGQIVAVRGELGVANISQAHDAIVCDGGEGSYCCASGAAQVVVRDQARQLFIEGSTCTGDISRLCCNRGALGQPVIASGRLTWRRWVEGAGEAWTLAEPELCEVDLPGG